MKIVKYIEQKPVKFKCPFCNLVLLDGNGEVYPCKHIGVWYNEVCGEVCYSHPKFKKLVSILEKKYEFDNIPNLVYSCIKHVAKATLINFQDECQFGGTYDGTRGDIILFFAKSKAA